MYGFFRQSSVADFPAAGETDPSRLARRKRRKIIVVEIALGAYELHGFNGLFQTGRGQSGRAQGLCLASLENSGAVCPGQNAYFNIERSHFIHSPAVHPFLARKYVSVDDFV